MISSKNFDKEPVELKVLTLRLKQFNKAKLIEKGYPLWIIDAEEEYLKSTIELLSPTIINNQKHSKPLPRPSKPAPQRKRYKTKKTDK